MEDGIEHRTVNVNGINMHIAEKGEGPLILFIHGFPDLWYSWRHQIAFFASRGYRCVAPDLRGFGDSDAPSSPSAYTSLHIVGDLIGLLDAVAGEEEKVFVVGHDWGALTAWSLCMYRPERVKALVNLSVAFTPRHPMRKPLQTLRAVFGNDYYICRFQESGVIEEEFAEIGTERVLKEFLTYRNPGPLYLPKGKGFGHPTESPIVLPSWLSEQECKYYASKFQKTGFTGGFNYYRSLDLNRAPRTTFTKEASKDMCRFWRRWLFLKVQATSSTKKGLMKSTNTSMTFFVTSHDHLHNPSSSSSSSSSSTCLLFFRSCHLFSFISRFFSRVFS